VARVELAKAHYKMSNFPIIRQAHIGPLRIIQRSYGVDYYWRNKWLLVSAPAYIGWRLKDYETERHSACFDLRLGYCHDGRWFKFPDWWRKLLKIIRSRPR
jgi:hypothetical protein